MSRRRALQTLGGHRPFHSDDYCTLLCISPSWRGQLQLWVLYHSTPLSSPRLICCASLRPALRCPADSFRLHNRSVSVAVRAVLSHPLSPEVTEQFASPQRSPPSSRVTCAGRVSLSSRRHRLSSSVPSVVLSVLSPFHFHWLAFSRDLPLLFTALSCTRMPSPLTPPASLALQLLAFAVQRRCGAESVGRGNWTEGSKSEQRERSGPGSEQRRVPPPLPVTGAQFIATRARGARHRLLHTAAGGAFRSHCRSDVGGGSASHSAATPAH